MKRPLEGFFDQPFSKRQKSFDLKETLHQLHQGYEKNDAEIQIKAYVELGDYYFEQKKDSINAVALYNFALAITKKPSLEGYRNKIIKKIKEAEREFLSSVLREDISPSDYVLDQAHQGYLETIRKEASAQLIRYRALKEIMAMQIPVGLSFLEKEIRLEETLEKAGASIQKIYREINEQLRRFVRLLVEECKQVLGRPPCEYAIICFGSLARDEATPYSDLEFAILLPEGENTEENKLYFRNLTKFLNIKILNLGETTPRMQDIRELDAIGLLGRYSESPTRQGFCFDGNNKGGRKTPLGNKYYEDVEEDKKYELIITPNQMKKLQGKKGYQKDRHLPSVLNTFFLIEGKVDLLNGLYKNDINKSMVLKLLSETILKFSPTLGRFTEEGHLFDLKYDLYRLPSLLLNLLSMYYGVSDQNIWNQLDTLFGKTGLIPEESVLKNLRWMASRIMEGRLEQHLRSGSRNNVLILDKPGQESDVLSLKSYGGMSGEVLLDSYRLLLCLAWVMEKFSHYYGEEDKRKTLFYGMFNKKQALVDGEIYTLRSQHKEAAGCYKKELRLDPNDFDVMIRLINVYLSFKDQQAFDLCSEAVESVREKLASAPNDSNLKHFYAELMDLMGHCHVGLSEWGSGDFGKIETSTQYHATGRAMQGIFCFHQSMEIYEDLEGGNSLSTAFELNNIGAAYYKEASNLSLRISSEQQFLSKVSLFQVSPELQADAMRLKVSNERLERAAFLRTALHYHKQALAIFRRELESDEFIVIANCMLNIGSSYYQIEAPREAQPFIEKSYKIIEKITGNYSSDVAMHLEALGAVHCALKNFDIAINYHEKVLKIRDDLGLSKESIYNNLGFDYWEKAEDNRSSLDFILSDLKKAREYFQEASKFGHAASRQNLLRLEDEISSTQMQIVDLLKKGNVCLLQDLMDIEQATFFYQQVNPTRDPNKPETHESLADDFYESNNLLMAIEHYQILLRLCPNNASAHHNLACMLHVRAQIEKNRDYYIEYHTYLRKAKKHFLRAASLDSNTGVYTEYAQFLWKNQGEYSVELLIETLEKAIGLQQLDERLTYGSMERSSIDKNLQMLVDKEKEISFKAYFLAHYLLIQVYCSNCQLEQAQMVYTSFETEVKGFNETSNGHQNRCAVQIAALEKELRLLHVLLAFSKIAINDALKISRALIQGPLNELLVQTEESSNHDARFPHGCI